MHSEMRPRSRRHEHETSGEKLRAGGRGTYPRAVLSCVIRTQRPHPCTVLRLYVPAPRTRTQAREKKTLKWFGKWSARGDLASTPADSFRGWALPWASSTIGGSA